MKKTAFIAAAAALLTAAPAAAQGYVGVEYGNLELSGAIDGDVWQGEAAFGWSNGNWGGQIGASFGNADFEIGVDRDFYTLDGHLYWRGASWRIGGVVAATQGDDDIDEWAYGLEAIVDTSPNTNIFGSLTAGTSDFGGADFDLWNFDVGGNFYATPNIRFGAIVGVGNIDTAGFERDTVTYGINGEFQPWAAPLSITLAWTRFDVDDSPLESDTIRIGARWNFGAATLQDRNNATPFTTTTGFVSRLFGIH